MLRFIVAFRWARFWRHWRKVSIPALTPSESNFWRGETAAPTAEMARPDGVALDTRSNISCFIESDQSSLTVDIRQRQMGTANENVEFVDPF